MRKGRLILMALVGALGLALTLGAEAQAQCGERIVVEIEQTEMGLMRAKEKVIEAAHSVSVASVERAKSLLEIAFTIQLQAKKNCQAGRGPLALGLTVEARKKGAAAIASINTRDENESLVERQLNKTDDLLARLREHIPADAPRPLRARIERVVETQRRAWELFRSGHPRMALKLTREAERSARQIARQLRQHGRLEEGLERRFAAVGELIDKVRQGLENCDNKRAPEVLEKASAALTEAKELFREGHLQQARTALKLAQRLAQRARALCNAQNRQGKFLQSLSARADQLAEKANSQNNREALDLIGKARRILGDAEGLINDGLNEAAAGQLKAAELLLRQANRLLER
ncbi:MAG: hypothetical protein ACE5GA_00925 [Candidatus Zixiibacteriota bacterium]